MNNQRYMKIQNLFLQQSYLDSWEDYTKSLRKDSFIKWDYIILTASNAAQAQAFRQQIDERVLRGQLPGSTHMRCCLTQKVSAWAPAGPHLTC